MSDEYIGYSICRGCVNSNQFFNCMLLPAEKEACLRNGAELFVSAEENEDEE